MSQKLGVEHKFWAQYMDQKQTNKKKTPMIVVAGGIKTNVYQDRQDGVTFYTQKGQMLTLTS